MGGFLKVVGALALIVVLLFVAFAAWAIISAIPLVKSATAYVDDAVPAIARKWDREELLKRMTPEMQASMTREGLDPVFTVFASFGTLVKYDGATGCSAGTTLSTNSGRTAWANCEATAKCVNANVLFRVGLVQVGKSWAIQSFFVSRKTTATTTGTSVGFGSTTAPQGLSLPLNWPGSGGHRRS